MKIKLNWKWKMNEIIKTGWKLNWTENEKWMKSKTEWGWIWKTVNFQNRMKINLKSCQFSIPYLNWKQNLTW